MTNVGIFKGTVRGNVIELDQMPGLPDGQPVTVVVRPTNGSSLSGGEGLRQSAGAWADDPDGLDQYLDWNRRQRKRGRAEHTR